MKISQSGKFLSLNFLEVEGNHRKRRERLREAVRKRPRTQTEYLENLKTLTKELSLGDHLKSLYSNLKAYLS